MDAKAPKSLLNVSFFFCFSSFLSSTLTLSLSRTPTPLSCCVFRGSLSRFLVLVWLLLVMRPRRDKARERRKITRTMGPQPRANEMEAEGLEVECREVENSLSRVDQRVIRV